MCGAIVSGSLPTTERLSKSASINSVRREHTSRGHGSQTRFHTVRLYWTLKQIASLAVEIALEQRKAKRVPTTILLHSTNY